MAIRKLLSVLLLLVYPMAVMAQANNCSNVPTQTNLPANGRDLTPSMGIDLWMPFGAGVTEAEVHTQSNLLASMGFQALGYNLFQLNDGWPASARVSGQLVGDATRFPSGMAALATFIHSNGQLAGIYSSPYTTTCGSYLGSGTFESTDAATFASWGYDYLWYDGCSVANLYSPSPNCWTTEGNAVFQMMAQAVTAAGRPMTLLIGTVNTLGDSWWSNLTWEQNAGFNELRPNTGDITGGWSVFNGSMDYAATVPSTIVKPGFWLNFDWLVTFSGNTAQQQTQMGMEAMFSSPLIMSADLSTLTSQQISIWQNPRVIGIDQDAMGKMATRTAHATCGSSFCDVWNKAMTGGKFAVALVNRDTATHTIGTTFQDGVAVDAYTGTNLGELSNYSATLAPYQSDVIIVTPQAPQVGMVNARLGRGSLQ